MNIFARNPATSLVSVATLLLLVVSGGAGLAKSNSSPAYEGPRFTGERPKRALETLSSVEEGLHYVAEKTRPAVVTVFVEKKVSKRGFPFQFRPPGQRGQQRKVQGLGSGAIIRSNGYIVTNHHVVEQVDRVQVLLPNKEKVEAKIVGTDPSTDLAVLKIDQTNLPELDFADSSKLRVGEWAIAVGSPFSLENSVSYGHISALHRSIQATQYENFIQTDAPINRGNSGGPLVNLKGEIIGINTLIQSTSGGSQGIGFASASNLVQRTVKDLIQHGEVKRAWLGVRIQDLPGKALKKHYGVNQGALVADVKENSPADTAGLKSGDLIVEYNGNPIEGPAALQRSVIQNEPGEEITLTVIRNEERQTLSVTLGERPRQEKQASVGSTQQGGILGKLGFSLGNLPPEKAARLGLDVKHPLPFIQKLQRGSIAHRAGLKPEDVILSVNRDNVKSAENLKEKLKQAAEQGEESVLLLVQRDSNRLFVSMPLPEEQ